jgi:shikimate dehydrogenase
VLHRTAYRELGLGDWSYDRFEIDEEALPGFFGDLGPEWAGLSLTMPLKRAVIPLLDEVSETAASVEAVNTVVFTEDGRRVGDNTDIPGMVAALRERGIEQVDSAAILGAGATASSALAALARICTGEVVAYVRSAERAAEMRQWGERLDVEVRTQDWVRRTPCPPRSRNGPRRSSTCCTTRGPPTSRPAGRATAVPWSADSTCSCTRRCSRSSG